MAFVARHLPLYSVKLMEFIYLSEFVCQLFTKIIKQGVFASCIVMSQIKNKKKEVLQSLIKTYKKKGFDNIKSPIAGYDDPAKLEYSWSSTQFKPDLTMDKGDERIVISVEDKVTEKDTPHLIQKWILLNSYSSKHKTDYMIVSLTDKVQEKVARLLNLKKINVTHVHVSELS